MNRRNFIRQSSVLGAAGLLLPLPGFSFGDAFPTVDTIYGKVRGMDVAGIKTFRGIHYGATTAGANRFMPPVKLKKWSGVVDAFAYGPASPQTPGNPTIDYTQAVNWDAHVKSGISEDCLVLNVWTPGLNDGAKRPVLFYIHGGGFNNGSGGVTFDGDPMSRLGDAVVITVNHRLGALGYLDLSSVGYPSKYKFAGVAGMMDLVAALEWVRDNITAFGGDPGNVMIFGQSGGGAKVSFLMAMPSAKGLFHKAAIQSGSALTAGPKEESTAVASKLAKELCPDASKPDEIQKVDFAAILEAKGNTSFHPVVDGNIIPHEPFDPKAPEESASVPLMLGYTFDDAAIFGSNRDLKTTDELRAWASENFKADGDKLVDAYSRVYSTASPALLRTRIATDSGFGLRAKKMAERKADQKKAPAYMFLVEWQSPAFEGKFGAVHGVDLGLVLADPRIPIESNTPAARKMAKTVGSAFAAFAKTGNPNCPMIPDWQPYTRDTRSVMIFNEESRVEVDPTMDLRLLWEKIGM